MTSRLEFFDLYRIRLGDDRPQSGVVQTVAVELRGVGENRFKLVTRIFDKYKRRSARYQDLLSTEYFIQAIDKSNEPDLIQLSYNPLFLTVMCYVYATKVNEANTFEVSVGGSMPEVVFNCVTLLLSDLDRDKARGLPNADRRAYERRRNEYVAEKEEFLRYLANTIVCEGRTSFDSAYLRGEVLKFFEHESSSPSVGSIVGQPDRFASQLIFSGLFVIVDRNANGVLYDFPHRRFREVLASSYFDSAPPARRAKLLQAYLEKGGLVEALFSVSTRQDEILAGILERSRGTKNGRYNGTLVSICTGRSSPGRARVFQNFLMECIDKNTIAPATEVMPELLAPDGDFLVSLAMSLDASLADRRENSLILTCFLLLNFSPQVLRDWLRKKLSLVPLDGAPRQTLLAHAALVDRDLFLSSLGEARADRAALLGFCYVAVRSVGTIDDPSDRVDFCRRLLKNLEDKEAIALLYFLAKHNGPVLSEVWEVLEDRLELLAVVIRGLVAAKDIGRLSDCYAVTNRLIREVESRDARELLRAKRGSLYSAGDFLLEGLMELERAEVFSKARVEPAFLAAVRSELDEMAAVGVEADCYLSDLFG